MQYASPIWNTITKSDPKKLENIRSLLLLLLLLLTASELSLGGSSPETRTYQTNKNKYT